MDTSLLISVSCHACCFLLQEEFREYVTRKGAQNVPVRCLKVGDAGAGIARIAGLYRTSDKIQKKLQGDNKPSGEASPEVWQAYLQQQDYTAAGVNVGSSDVKTIDEWNDIVSQLWAEYKEVAVQVSGTVGKQLAG
jgi:DNA-directed RNA polymerase subunit N (RpoN/RPB10)